MTPGSRIANAINSATESPALVAFLTAGFPSREQFAKNLLAVCSEADVVEIDDRAVVDQRPRDFRRRREDGIEGRERVLRTKATGVAGVIGQQRRSGGANRGEMSVVGYRR